jgi:hypothetical protein
MPALAGGGERQTAAWPDAVTSLVEAPGDAAHDVACIRYTRTLSPRSSEVRVGGPIDALSL